MENPCVGFYSTTYSVMQFPKGLKSVSGAGFPLKGDQTPQAATAEVRTEVNVSAKES